MCGRRPGTLALVTEEERVAREVTARAIRRLRVLEWTMLLAAALLATLGGAVTALVLRELAGLTFRPTWIASSLALFLVPTTVAYLRERRERGGGRSDDPPGERT